MDGGVVERIASPVEGYEGPRTPFGAGFIGSLNAIDFRVGELSNGVAIMRLGEARGIVAPASPATRPGAQLRLAVRPERVRIDPVDERAPNGGARVEGAIADQVYLGGVTHFYVDADRVGRIVCHRLADDGVARLEPGRRVVLTWSPEHAYVLADS